MRIFTGSISIPFTHRYAYKCIIISRLKQSYVPFITSLILLQKKTELISKYWQGDMYQFKDPETFFVESPVQTIFITESYIVFFIRVYSCCQRFIKCMRGKIRISLEGSNWVGIGEKPIRPGQKSHKMV